MSFSRKYFKFSELNSITSNPASETLHFSNLPRALSQEALARWLAEQGLKPVAIRLFEGKGMALVRLPGLELAVRAMGRLHCAECRGRQLHLSFTRNTADPN